MAGDYVPFDHDFPEKPETLRIARNTGVTVAQLMLRMHLLWRMFDRQTDDGILRGLDLRALEPACGGDESFWSEVVAAGWLRATPEGLEMPKFKERFKTSARERMKRYRANKSAARAQQTRHGARNKRATPAQPRYAPEPEPEPVLNTPSLSLDKTPRKFAESTLIPEPYQTAEFVKAWNSWLDHRAGIQKPLTGPEADEQLADMLRRGWDAGRATEAIRFTIRSGGRGAIFENDRPAPASKGGKRKSIEDMDLEART